MSKSSARYATAGRAVGYIAEENNTALPRVDRELIEQLSDTACDLSYFVPATQPQLTTPRQKGPQLFTTSLLALSRGHSELGGVPTAGGICLAMSWSLPRSWLSSH